MPVSLGVFVTPDATDVQSTLAQIEAADEAGLDLVAIQDHPYQRRFLDTWTLLAYAAAPTPNPSNPRSLDTCTLPASAAAPTSRVTLLPDVANLPLRPPAPLAK